MFKGALFFCMYSRYFHSHIVIAIRMDVELNSHKAVFINKNSTDKFKSSLDADIQGNIYLQKKMVPEFKLCSNFLKIHMLCIMAHLINSLSVTLYNSYSAKMVIESLIIIILCDVNQPIICIMPDLFIFVQKL